MNKNKSRGAFAKPYFAYRVSVLALTTLLSLAAFSSRSAAAPPQSDDAAAILTLLNDQTAAWNRGDIDGFMAGYWKSEETEFVELRRSFAGLASAARSLQTQLSGSQSDGPPLVCRTSKFASSVRPPPMPSANIICSAENDNPPEYSRSISENFPKAGALSSTTRPRSQSRLPRRSARAKIAQTIEGAT